MSTLVVGNLQSDDLLPPVIKNSGGTEIGTFCRAWVNFNGTGTVAIRASFNVSSITDNGTGDYTVNFTTAMPDANYALAGSAGSGASGSAYGMSFPETAVPTASAARVTIYNKSAAAQDYAYTTAAIFR